VNDQVSLPSAIRGGIITAKQPQKKGLPSDSGRGVEEMAENDRFAPKILCKTTPPHVSTSRRAAKCRCRTPA
jgi:hypothetical protein